jgi:hypothetical protein
VKDPDFPEPKIVAHETTVAPRTYLLASGWWRHGRIRLEEEPARPRQAPSGFRGATP